MRPNLAFSLLTSLGKISPVSNDVNVTIRLLAPSTNVFALKNSQSIPKLHLISIPLSIHPHLPNHQTTTPLHHSNASYHFGPLPLLCTICSALFNDEPNDESKAPPNEQRIDRGRPSERTKYRTRDRTNDIPNKRPTHRDGVGVPDIMGCNCTTLPDLIIKHFTRV